MNYFRSFISRSRILASSFIFNHKRQFHLNKPKILCKKYDLDYSNYPQLNEKDLEKQFVRGSGPGGQAVNKAMNCVHLKHIPSGLAVRCHATRSLEQNKKIARELLLEKLDNHLNGESSLANQRKRIDDERRKRTQLKKQKLHKIKEEWKKREGLPSPD